MFDHHATTDFASRITHPHIQTTSNQSFRHHTNEKYAQKQHKMANLEVESDRLKKHQTPPHQQKTRNQQHKMAYKPKESGSVKTRSALFSSVELFFTPFLEL
ncbi:hypothetical protein [Trueperella pyogenes]|uniref:hypothetical protein n=1 Tax=Trueperella pyogenes TaxID=1661 RepID=UPI00345C6B3D